MGIVVVPAFGADPVTITGPTLDAKVDGLATEFNGNIDNDNIDSAAAIANSKLNLASVAQNVSFAGTVALTGVNTISGVTTMSSKIFKLAKGADVASANALSLGTDGNYFDITGTTAITSIGTLGVGTVVRLHFDGILTFTHHSTDLILPGGASITTAAGDEAELVEYATGDWRCTSYTKASGTAVVATTPTAANALSGSVVNYQIGTVATVVTCNAALPIDNSIPQSGEGVEVVTVSITPSNSSNILKIKAYASGCGTTAAILGGAIFQDATAGALNAATGSYIGTNENAMIVVEHTMTAGTTSSTTFKLRIGTDSGATYYVNGNQSGTRNFGGVSTAHIEVWEIKA